MSESDTISLKFVSDWETSVTAKLMHIVGAKLTQGTVHKLRCQDFGFFWPPKGQLNSEWIYEVIFSSKIPTKNYRDFCPGSLLEGRAEISVILGWDFGRNNDHLKSFWI